VINTIIETTETLLANPADDDARANSPGRRRWP
jgi:alcohol dehydrogenase YqhD (iron-dependent ADH family)